MSGMEPESLFPPSQLQSPDITRVNSYIYIIKRIQKHGDQKAFKEASYMCVSAVKLAMMSGSIPEMPRSVRSLQQSQCEAMSSFEVVDDDERPSVKL